MNHFQHFVVPVRLCSPFQLFKADLRWPHLGFTNQHINFMNKEDITHEVKLEQFVLLGSTWNKSFFKIGIREYKRKINFFFEVTNQQEENSFYAIQCNNFPDILQNKLYTLRIERNIEEMGFQVFINDILRLEIASTVLGDEELFLGYDFGSTKRIQLSSLFRYPIFTGIHIQDINNRWIDKVITSDNCPHSFSEEWVKNWSFVSYFLIPRYPQYESWEQLNNEVREQSLSIKSSILQLLIYNRYNWDICDLRFYYPILNDRLESLVSIHRSIHPFGPI